MRHGTDPLNIAEGVAMRIQSATLQEALEAGARSSGATLSHRTRLNPPSRGGVCAEARDWLLQADADVLEGPGTSGARRVLILAHIALVL